MKSKYTYSVVKSGQFESPKKFQILLDEMGEQGWDLLQTSIGYHVFRKLRPTDD